MTDIPEPIRDAIVSIAGVYEHHDGGGNLHIVIDDWNVEDSSLEFCTGLMTDPAWKAGLVKDGEWSPELEAAEWRCIRALQGLTPRDRMMSLLLLRAMEQGRDELDAGELEWLREEFDDA